MTTPGTDPSRLATAATATGGDKPQLAFALANSDLSDTEVHNVGSFARAMQLSVTHQLATEAGIKPIASAQDKNQLAAIGENPEDTQPDSRSWLEKATDTVAGALSNTLSFLVHNPVSDKLFAGLDQLGNAVHMPFRLLSDAIDTSNDSEIDREMTARGYDPNSTASYLAFMWNQGQSQYHDLSRLRDVYGDEDVDTAIQVLADPEQFQADLLKKAPEDAAALKAKMQSKDFQNILDAVDRKHISPGRDLARLILPEGKDTEGKTFTQDGSAFTFLSGALDGAFDWFTDPTLIVGKAAKVARAMDVVTGATEASRLRPSTWLAKGYDWARGGAQRARLAPGQDTLIDQGGIEAALATDEHGKAQTAIGKGWSRYLADAGDYRSALADGDANRAAGIWTAMQSRYGHMMSLLDEINGHRVIPDDLAQSGFRVERLTESALQTDGKPIETLDDLADHLVSTNGLMRINSGWAARREMIMPGRLSWWATHRAAGDTHAAKSAERWLDYSKPEKLIPNSAEREILDKYGNNPITRAGLAQARMMDRSMFTSARVGLAKFERVRRRFSSQVPNVTAIDLQATTAPKLVEQMARTYMNRGDAARAAAMFQNADTAGRRAIVRGMIDQAFHASGLSRSEAGRAYMQRYLGDLDEIGTHKYGYGDTSKIKTDRGDDVEVAMYPDQVSQHVVIPSFREMSYNAAKFAVGGWAARQGLAHMSALTQGNGADALMGLVKAGWITSAAGGLRNALDEIANFAAYGMGKDVLAARVAYTKATTGLRADRRAAYHQRRDLIRVFGRNAADDRVLSQLDERVKSVHDAELEHERALANPEEFDVADAATQLNRAKEDARKAALLATAISHRLPYAFRRVGDGINDVLIGAVLGKAMSVFGKDWAITGDRVKYAQELQDQELTRILSDGVFQAHFADTQLLNASDHTVMDHARSGVKSRPYGYRPNGWGMVEADGGAGLDALANVLRLRFTDSASPAHAWVQTYRALPHATPEERKAALAAARDSVRGRLDDEDLQHFVKQAEMFHWSDGARIGPDDHELLNRAKDEYADRVTLDLAHALGKRDGGGISDTLLDELLAGRVPDRSWLAQNLPVGERPEKAIGQLWAPYNPKHQPGQYPSGYTQFMSRAYGKVVTDQINALSRNPLMTALYMRARSNTEGYVKHLVDSGWDPAIADEVAKREALRQAETEAFKHIDNPYVSSQFSLLSRNVFAFVRAQEDWLRRWGRTIKDNPEIIRKGQLLIHGGTATGFLEKDDTGQLHFVYPGSSLALGFFGSMLGLVNSAGDMRVPVTGELSSQLTSLNPSLDNPIGLTGTPLISLPFRALRKLLGPEHALLTSSMDKIINGDLGAGRTWWESILPSWANRIIGALDEDPGTKWFQSMAQAGANLKASGLLEDPEFQTPEGKAQLLHALGVQTHNALIANTILGFFLPASPTYEGQADHTADGFQGETPDLSAHLAGLRSLKDEARQVFSKLPFEEALAWWAKVHPNESVLSPAGGSSMTTVGANGASAPASIAAVEHMQKNKAFYDEYGGKGGIAAFLIPQGLAGTKNGEFSDVAYRSQLELHIRDYKTLDDYFDDIMVSRGLAEYFDAKDKHDQAVDRAAGSPTLTRQLDDQWAQTKAEIVDRNPLLPGRLAQAAVNNATDAGTRAQLEKMASDTKPSTLQALGVNRAGLITMLDAQQRFQTAIASLGDRRGNAANRQRAQIKSSYDAEIQDVSAQYPGLADLARAVFRIPS